MHHAGLILEGGGMRGVYTAGILDFFLDKEIEFKEIYGVSAGSCHACSYLSKQRGRAFDVNVQYLDDPQYCSVRSLVKTGNLFGAEMLYHTIPDKLNQYDYDTFMKYQGKFYAVLTNCVTGEPVYYPVREMHKDISAIQASSSLPLVSKMVWIEGVPYLDGGISDSIPLEQSLKNGNKWNVVILTRDSSYRKSPNSMMPLIKARYKKYPKLVEQMKNRHLHYNRTLKLIEKGEKAGKVFVIRPKKPVEIGRIEKNREKLTKLFNEGYEDAEKCYDQLAEFLEKADKNPRG